MESDVPREVLVESDVPREVLVESDVPREVLVESEMFPGRYWWSLRLREGDGREGGVWRAYLSEIFC